MDPIRALLNAIIASDSHESFEKFGELKDKFDSKLRQYITWKFIDQGENFMDELIQKTWLQVWEKAYQCKGTTQASIFKWIKTIAHNLGMNMVRDLQKLNQMIAFEDFETDLQADQYIHPQQSRHPQIMIGDEVSMSGEDTQIKLEFAESVKLLIHQLTPQEHNAFTLWVNGHPKNEIARMLNVKPPRVTQLFDQIAKKKKKLDQSFLD